jgi:hypothetical protein
VMLMVLVMLVVITVSVRILSEIDCRSTHACFFTFGR